MFELSSVRSYPLRSKSFRSKLESRDWLDVKALSINKCRVVSIHRQTEQTRFDRNSVKAMRRRYENIAKRYTAYLEFG